MILISNVSMILISNVSMILISNVSMILISNVSMILISNVSMILISNVSMILISNVSMNKRMVVAMFRGVFSFFMKCCLISYNIYISYADLNAEHEMMGQVTLYSM